MTDQHNPSRAAFEQWYACNAFDYEKNPVGSRDCGLQWSAWQAARKAALEEAQAICEGIESTFASTAKSKFVTEFGSTLHTAMSKGASNCANEIKELLK